MSTKVYNAYKYDGSLETLLSKLKEVRSKYQDQTSDLLSRYGNLEIPTENDELVKLKDLSDNILGEIFFSNYLEDRMKKGINEPTNIQASAVVYPYNKQLFVHFFGIKDELIKTIDGLTDYHYQDQCDMSNYDWDEEDWDKMTSERQKELDDDWDVRKKTWDDILGWKAPSESGFVFDFHPNGYNMTLFCSTVTQKIKERNV